MKLKAMKAKNFILGLSVLAIVPSCSVDQVTAVNEDNVISFRTVVPHSTRGTATTASSLDEFSVWGFVGDELMMEHVTATRNGNSYSTDPVYFWASASMDFYALSPAVSEGDDEVLLKSADGTQTIGTVAIAANGDATTGLGNSEIEITGIPYSADNQVDLIYAAHPNATSGSSVSLNFRHALSQIVFHAENTNSDMQVRIKGVRIACVYGANTYTLPVNTDGNLTDVGSTEGVAGYQGTWGEDFSDLAFFKAGITTSDDTYINVPGDGVPVNLTNTDGAMFMLPQQVPAWNQNEGDHYNTEMGAYFLIDCKIINGEVELWPATDGVDYAEVAVPVEVAWEEGYKYTYTFIFGEGAGYYPPTGDGISDYPTDPEVNSSAPVDPENGADPTPILSPIQFLVDIDEIQSFDDPDSEDGSIEVSTEPVEPEDITKDMVDEVFIEWCLENFDKNGNGHISQEEIESVHNFDLPDVDIKDFTGIEHFENLQYFYSISVETVDFSQNVNLTHVKMGNSDGNGAPIVTLDLSNNTNITILYNYDFAYCDKLTTIILPESITEIGSYTFYYCTSLSSVNIPDGVTAISGNAFSHCTSLKSITLPSNLTTIGTFAFGYTGLTSITIPESVELIDYGAFCRSYDLSRVTVNAETPPDLGLYAFHEISESAVLYVPSGCKDAYAQSDWAEFFTDIQEK